MGDLIHYLFIARFLLGGLHSEMVLDVPELREGIPGNITCSVNKVKRPAKIELSLGNKSLPEIRQENIYDTASGTYTSIKTVTGIDRSWNDKSFGCMSYIQGPTNDSYVFHAFKSQTVVFKYPPSSMTMISSETPINMLPWYELTIACVTNDSNADCMIKWTSDLQDLHLNRTTQVRHRDIVSTLLGNVSHGYSGHTISCHIECVDFFVHITKVYTIDLPRPPIITIRPAYERTVTGNLAGALKCEVDSNPIGNISWIATQTNDTQINCRNSTVCLLQLNEMTVDSVIQYACLAVNVHGQDHKSFYATNGQPAVRIIPTFIRGEDCDSLHSLECEVDFNPMSKISWIDINCGECILAKCENSDVCVLRINNHESTTEFKCLAVNVFGYDQEIFNVNLQSRKTAVCKGLKTTELPWLIYTLIGSGTLLFVWCCTLGCVIIVKYIRPQFQQKWSMDRTARDTLPLRSPRHQIVAPGGNIEIL